MEEVVQGRKKRAREASFGPVAEDLLEARESGFDGGRDVGLKGKKDRTDLPERTIDRGSTFKVAKGDQFCERPDRGGVFLGHRLGGSEGVGDPALGFDPFEKQAAKGREEKAIDFIVGLEARLQEAEGDHFVEKVETGGGRHLCKMGDVIGRKIVAKEGEAGQSFAGFGSEDLEAFLEEGKKYRFFGGFGAVLRFVGLLGRGQGVRREQGIGLCKGRSQGGLERS